jgi:ABC-type bacteriocin/lantibiotic exporter with double-glycine peptidase domain
MLFGNIAIMCVLWYGGYLVLQGELTVGSLSAFVLYNITLAGKILLL